MRKALLTLMLALLTACAAQDNGTKPDVSIRGTWEVGHETTGRR